MGSPGIGPQTLGSPPWRRPRSPGEGGQATRDRPPGTHARGKRSKEVYNYTSIQSIQYTLYSIQCTWVQYTVCTGYSIQYTGYKGIRVYSIQGTKGSGKRASCPGSSTLGTGPANFMHSRTIILTKNATWTSNTSLLATFYKALWPPGALKRSL